MIETLPFNTLLFIAVLLVVGIWSGIWKGIALWKSGRNNQLTWFISILIVNSLGILPIIYLVWFQKPQTIIIPKEKKTKKKK